LILFQVTLDVFNPSKRLANLLEKKLIAELARRELSCGVKQWNYFPIICDPSFGEAACREINEWNARSKRLECRFVINHALFSRADDSMRMRMLKVSLLRCLDFLAEQDTIVANLAGLRECTTEVCDKLIAKLALDTIKRANRKKAN